MEPGLQSRSTESQILSFHCLVLRQTSYLSLEIGKALSHLSKGSSGAHPLRPAVPHGAFPFRQQGERYCIHSEERSPQLAGDSLSVAPPHASQLFPFCVPLLVQERLCNPRFCVLECKVFLNLVSSQEEARKTKLALLRKFKVTVSWK